jgi:hypothetical protein
VVELLRSAARLEKELRTLKLPFCFIGGIAVQRWAEPRATRDLDLSLLCGFGGEERAIDGLFKVLAPRIPNARTFALVNRVALLRTKSGVEVDVALAGLPFEEELQRRASKFTFAKGVRLTTCSAEDLIVLKAFADRSKDWGDVESVCQRQRRLDWPYIERQLGPLVEAKGSPEILDSLRRLRPGHAMVAMGGTAPKARRPKRLPRVKR